MIKKKPKISVVGAGHLGRHHIKHLAKHKDIEFVGAFDTNNSALQKICTEFSVNAISSIEELISKCTAVHIVTPTNTHFELGKLFLENNLDVLIEKPITKTVKEAKGLIEIADQNKCILQVGHIERFNPTINKLKQLISSPHYIEIERLAPFQARGTEVPVILDLMVHDIDMILEMIDSPIKNIQASGAKMMSSTIDLAHAHIQFNNGVVANLKSSRIAQGYVRKIRTYEKNLYSITDLMIPQIEVYGLENNGKFSAQSISEIVKTSGGEKTVFYEKFIPEQKDALLEEINNFIESIVNRTPPNVDGRAGKKALDIAIQIESKIFLND